MQLRCDTGAAGAARPAGRDGALAAEANSSPRVALRRVASPPLPPGRRVPSPPAAPVGWLVPGPHPGAGQRSPRGMPDGASTAKAREAWRLLANCPAGAGAGDRAAARGLMDLLPLSEAQRTVTATLALMPVESEAGARVALARVLAALDETLPTMVAALAQLRGAWPTATRDAAHHGALVAHVATALLLSAVPPHAWGQAAGCLAERAAGSDGAQSDPSGAQ